MSTFVLVAVFLLNCMSPYFHNTFVTGAALGCCHLLEVINDFIVVLFVFARFVADCIINR